MQISKSSKNYVGKQVKGLPARPAVQITQHLKVFKTALITYKNITNGIYFSFLNDLLN